ncbi:MAG: VWA domain-containing protein, partial [Candidatus Promineifilaceae bacterium]
PQDQALDQALEMLYGEGGELGDLSDSAPDIARWLGDIRGYFPDNVVRIMQRDALDRFKLRRVLEQPELLAAIEPDVQLVADILALRRTMPVQTRETARAVVQQVVDDLREKLRYPLEQAIKGSLDRATRTRRPRLKEINWQRTIYKNLKHYQPEQRTIVPETLVGYGRKRSSLRDIIIALDTSGSMAQSVVYGSIYAAVLASIPAVTTRLVMFDTSVVDLSEALNDPVELVFGIRLGGGTHIDRAIAYCQGLIGRPQDTVLVLISDLYEGGDKASLLRRLAELAAGGVQVVLLLALNDKGAPRFDREIAAELAALGLPAFACTPALFPNLMAAVLEKRDLRQWTAVQGVVTAPDN